MKTKASPCRRCGVLVALAADARRPATSSAGTLTGAGQHVRRRRSSRRGRGLRARRPATKIDYSPVGSGAGIAAITARTVDFGACDAPLTPDQFSGLQRLRPDPVGARRRPDHLQPRRACPNNLQHHRPCAREHLPRQDHEVERPGDQGAEPEANLPRPKITPVYRSDGSGTSYNFTDYLVAVSPDVEVEDRRLDAAHFPAGVGAQRHVRRRRRRPKTAGRDRLRRRRVRARRTTSSSRR